MYTTTGVTSIVPFASLVGNNTLRFYTNSFADIGVHKFQLWLSDGQLSSYKDVYVELFNNPPYFIKEVPANMTLRFNNTFEYRLPPYEDEEGNAIIVYFSGVPPVNAFITLLYQEKIVIKPTLWSQLGNYTLNITFSDTQKTKSYFFDVTIFNTPPYFASGIKPPNQRFRLGTPFNFTLPDCQDDNFNPIYVV